MHELPSLKMPAYSITWVPGPVASAIALLPAKRTTPFMIPIPNYPVCCLLSRWGTFRLSADVYVGSQGYALPTLTRLDSGI